MTRPGPTVGSEPQLDPLFVIVRGRPEVELLLRHLAQEILLGERRALVGALRLGAEQDDTPVKPLLPQRLCRAAAGHVGAHDDDRAHLTVPSGPADAQARSSLLRILPTSAGAAASLTRSVRPLL